MTGKINFAIISDVHLGKSTETTIAGLRNFLNNEVTEELDILFISGDFFDKLLDYHTVVQTEIDIIVCEILNRCKDSNVKLRVLEGTPSHDRRQPASFISVNKLAGINCDVKYFDTVNVERMTDLNLDILYVPDEWRSSADITMQDIKEAIWGAGLQKVDIAIMHGVFSFQLPPAALNSIIDIVFMEKWFDQLVTGGIFIGHHHTPATFVTDSLRIMAPGSFNRLKHGEEERKGALKSTYEKGTLISDIRFIENTLANQFRTIDLTDIPETMTTVDFISLVQSRTKEIDPDSTMQIRYVINSNNLNYKTLTSLVRYEPALTVKAEHVEDEAIADNKPEYDFSEVTYTRESIKDILTKTLEGGGARTELFNSIINELVYGS